MHVSDSLDDLGEHGATHGLGQLLRWQLLDVVLERHSLAQFHHQVHLGPLVNHLVQAHDVWVVLEIAQRVDFRLNCIRRFRVHQVLLLVGFQGHPRLGFLVLRATHDGKGPLPDFQPDLKLPQV